MKQFVEDFSSIDVCSFPFSSMQLFSNSPEGITIQGVAFKVFEDKLQVCKPESDCFYEISFSLTPAYYGTIDIGSNVLNAIRKGANLL